MLTSDQIAALSGRELDHAVAESVMGWKRLPNYNYWMTQGGVGGFELHGLIATWSPSTDASASRLVLEEIQKRNLRRQFSEALHDEVTRALPAPTVPRGWDLEWHLVNATPEQICRSALLSVMENEEKGQPR